MESEVFALLGQVVVVAGGASVIAYQAFKFLAAKWLEQKFKTSLQQLVHDQNKEIERLKLDLTKSFDRATKLNHREFEALPEIWDKVNEAYWSAAALVSPLQTYADLNRMLPKQLSEFIGKSELADWQKDEVNASVDKTKTFNEFFYWYKLNRAMRAHREADIWLSRTGIFVQEDIKQKLQSVLDLVRGALIEDEVNHEHPPLRHAERLNTDIDRIRTDGKAWMEDADKLLRQRLWG